MSYTEKGTGDFCEPQNYCNMPECEECGFELSEEEAENEETICESCIAEYYTCRECQDITSINLMNFGGLCPDCLPRME